ncbi:MAG TPA: DUF2333 family protein [Candidatus Limnocylindrales bacterium]|nr:DUF2333 family protein [Candidatus Limnocylindrales bacterium]
MLQSAAGAILILLFLVTPLFLHFTQISHNRLPFHVHNEFPADRPMVGGEAFASTVAALVQHELDSTTGWRPNDFILWGPALMADNNANRQLGIIQAVRESTRVFRDHLTKVSASEYDQNLVDAETRLRNDEHKFWFPSAESRFRDGVESLRRYVAGLATPAPTSKPINRRNVELIRLFQTWTDMLGDAHANLLREDVGFLQTDDHFYHAQGVAHVMFHLTVALRREYETSLAGREAVLELFDHVAHSLREAAWIKPLVVMNGGPSGIFANHRRNLDVFIIDARQLMYTIREELEK